MPIDEFSHHREDSPKKRFAEDIYHSLPEVETGVEIPKVSATRLTTGKDADLKLSIKEKLGREGWDYDILANVHRGDVLLNRSGEIFKILEVKQGNIKIINTETQDEGEIIAAPRTLKAHEYSYNLRAGSKHSRKIKVYDTVYKDRSLDTSDFIDDIVKSIPASCLDVFDEIQIHRIGGKTGAFHAEPSLFADRKILSLYVSEEGYATKGVIETMYHELGHAIAKYLKGTTNPGERWKRSMQADGNPVSEYASKTKYPKLNDTGEVEDFADSVMLYLATDAAKTDKTRPLRDFCRNRFQKLDEVFEDLSKQQGTSKLKKLLSKPKTSLGK